MAKFYTISLDDIFLTDSGLETGLPCKLELIGADALLSNYTGTTTIAVDGTPINQIFTNSGRGRVLEIKPLVLLQPVWENVVALINNASVNSVTINIVGTGDVGDFDVTAVPLLPRPFEAQNFKNGRIKGVVLRFITI